MHAEWEWRGESVRTRTHAHIQSGRGGRDLVCTHVAHASSHRVEVEERGSVSVHARSTHAHTHTHTHTPNVEWRGRVSSHARSARRVEGESQCVRILIVVHEERGVGGRVGVYSRTHADWKGRVGVGPHVRHV